MHLPKFMKTIFLKFFYCIYIFYNINLYTYKTNTLSSNLLQLDHGPRGPTAGHPAADYRPALAGTGMTASAGTGGQQLAMAGSSSPLPASSSHCRPAAAGQARSPGGTLAYEDTH